MGLSLRLTQAYGETGNGVGNLFRDELRAGAPATGRWTTELAYGLPVYGGRLAAIPSVTLTHGRNAAQGGAGLALTPNVADPDIALQFHLGVQDTSTQGMDALGTVDLEYRW